jgi:uncharacterized protein YgiM (DUF1202 family)
MVEDRKLALASLAVVGLLFATSSAALAAAGDVLRVTGQQVNLRAGPSDQTNVRGRVTGGEELIELTREGNWYGVRVLRTGEEGWIFADLVERVATSTLGTGALPAPTTAGFRELSERFDRVMDLLNRELGYSLIDRVEQVDGDRLRVRANPEWLRATSRDAHLMAAAAIYEMWKNHQNSAPVQVVMRDRDSDYITIVDEATGPRLSIASLGEG